MKYFTAVMNGDTAAVKKFLLNDFDVNIKDPSNETGIIIAIDRNDVAMVNLLLEHGADVNLTSNNIDNTRITDRQC